jgi:CheY-like chemotaxis protein
LVTILRLLLVDDHDDTLEFMSRLLRARGHVVTTARSVAEAEALCEAQQPFDLAVCDLQLPDGTGGDLMAGALRRCGTPGIALSGHGSHEDRERSRAAGFAVHLTKPVALDALEAAIRQAVPNDVAGSSSPKR